MQQLDVAAVQEYFRNLFSWKERRSGGMIMPDERLPWGETTVLGLQHVLAMFGATVLAPLLMGFDPNTAIFFSGIGTIIFFIATGGKIPSYLGSSFAFIAPVLAITTASSALGENQIPYALGGIIICGLIYTLIGVAVAYYGSDWIDALMPPIVTGAVVAIIGLNLAWSGAKPLAESNMPLAIITMLSIVAVAILGKGLVGRLPILIGTGIGYLVALILGGTSSQGRTVLGIHWQGVDLQGVGDASIIGLPNFTAPKFDGSAIGLLAPVAIILVAENTGHIKAISEMTGRNMMPYLGRGFIGDGVATMVAGAGGGTGVTTYAENIGVMSVTRIFSTAMFVVAAGVAIVLGFSPMFGALVLSIPNGVLGGVSVVLFGLIAVAGIRIWVDNQVDFSKGINLFLAALVLIVGTADLTLSIGNFDLNGIALGTFGAIILYQVFGKLPGATDEDPGATPASAPPADFDGGDFRPEPRERRRPREQRRQEPRRDRQRQRRPQPPVDDFDEFDDFDQYPGEPPQAPPPPPARRGQPPPNDPRRGQRPPAANEPPRRRQRPPEQEPPFDPGYADETGAEMPPPPAMPQPPTPPRMPQPPTRRRRGGAPEPDPEVDDWDDDIGFVRDNPRRSDNR